MSRAAGAHHNVILLYYVFLSIFSLLSHHAMIVTAHSAHSAHTCTIISTDSSSTFYYAPTVNDTIFSVSARFHLSICAIARANRMADATLLTPGVKLIIPSASASCNNTSSKDSDDTTCLVHSLLPPSSAPATQTCLFGGPHTYTVWRGDTLRYIAQKLNLTLEALGGNSRLAATPDMAIPVGSTIKIPQCAGSTCELEPYKFTYGTYADLARTWGATVGQLMAINYGYNTSSSNDTAAPVITLVKNCRSLTGNCTTAVGGPCQVID